MELYYLIINLLHPQHFSVVLKFLGKYPSDYRKITKKFLTKSRTQKWCDPMGRVISKTTAFFWVWLIVGKHWVIYHRIAGLFLPNHEWAQHWVIFNPANEENHWRLIDRMIFTVRNWVLVRERTSAGLWCVCDKSVWLFLCELRVKDDFLWAAGFMSVSGLQPLSTPLICFSSDDLWPPGRQGHTHASDWLREAFGAFTVNGCLYLTPTGSRPKSTGICLKLPPPLMTPGSCCLLLFVLWFINAGNSGRLWDTSGGRVVFSVMHQEKWFVLCNM